MDTFPFFVLNLINTDQGRHAVWGLAVWPDLDMQKSPIWLKIDPLNIWSYQSFAWILQLKVGQTHLYLEKNVWGNILEALGTFLVQSLGHTGAG